MKHFDKCVWDAARDARGFLTVSWMPLAHWMQVGPHARPLGDTQSARQDTRAVHCPGRGRQRVSARQDTGAAHAIGQ